MKRAKKDEKSDLGMISDAILGEGKWTPANEKQADDRLNAMAQPKTPIAMAISDELLLARLQVFTSFQSELMKKPLTELAKELEGIVEQVDDLQSQEQAIRVVMAVKFLQERGVTTK